MTVTTPIDADPMISVITPYRDAREFLPGLVATLQAQTYRNWECLLVDHASSDGGGILASLLTASDSRFRHLRIGPEAGGGIRRPAIPRNAALDQIRGDLVCYLDVDDLWHPEKLERQLSFHRKHWLDFSVTAYVRTMAHRTACLTWRCPPSALSLRRLRLGNPVPMLTVMMDAKLIKGLTAETQLRFAPVHHEDYVLWLQLWRQVSHLRYGCLPEILALHQRHGGNTTSNRLAMVRWLFDVHAIEASIPLAAWRTLLSSGWQVGLRLREFLGFRRVFCEPKELLRQSPLSIARFSTIFLLGACCGVEKILGLGV